MLDIKSSTRGVLIPRLTIVQRDVIVNPASGLMVFNTSLNTFEFFTGGKWQSINSTPYEGNNVGDMLVWNGTSWQSMTLKTFYADRDGDGLGDHFSAITGLAAPFGYVTNDCDEDDNNISFDGFVPDFWYPDYDGDGYGNPDGIEIQNCFQPSGHINNNWDCDDSNPEKYLGALEIQDGLDNNCDGQVDEQTIFYVDNDLDGYGDASLSTLSWYPAPDGYVANATDCDDDDYYINPGIAFEACDGIDNNCDGIADEAPVYVFADNDEDGYGDYDNLLIWDCITDPETYYVLNYRDCDDYDPFLNPDATEICDGVDNDCNGQIDDNITAVSTFYQDLDQDGYGNPAITVQAPGCTGPAGYVLTGMDCDDSDAGINPGQLELCNGLDENCNGEVDEGMSIDGDIYYEDYDGDGFGNDWVQITLCSLQPGWSANNLDCDDTNPNIHPDATEICDFIDNDCDFMLDEGLPTITYYYDQDGDGYGHPSFPWDHCSQPDFYVGNSLDCNDLDPAINPNAVEVCDDLDNNCDGQVDEGLTTYTWYRDFDGDGYGDINMPFAKCSQPAGYVPDNTDCDDYNFGVNPGMVEICDDGLDNDCDGTFDELDCTTP